MTNNGRPMNPSLSEDSVAETALSKKNSDGELPQNKSTLSLPQNTPTTCNQKPNQTTKKLVLNVNVNVATSNRTRCVSR